jgi:hypothetical protein
VGSFLWGVSVGLCGVGWGVLCVWGLKTSELKISSYSVSLGGGTSMSDMPGGVAGLSVSTAQTPSEYLKMDSFIGSTVALFF